MDPVTQHAAVNTYLSRCEADGAFTIIEIFGVIQPEIPERYNHQRIGNQATLEEDIRLQARILEQMSEAILLVNTTNGEIVYTNPMAERMFAYEKGGLIGKSIATLNDPAEAHPQETAAEIFRVLNEKGSWQGEVRNIRKDGIGIWCSSSVSTFTHPVYGEVWLGVQRDITERKEMEQALLRQETLKASEIRSRSIIDASPVPLAINDAHGNITFLNNAFVQTLGYTVQEIPTLADWWPRAYPDPRYQQWVLDTWQKNLSAAINDNMPFAPIELNIHCKDHSVRTFMVSASPLEEGFGGDHLVSLYDITERKQAELTLLATRNEAERANAAKSEFLSRMSHELRTPLNAILGFGQLLTMDKTHPLDELQANNVQEIIHAGDHLLELINEILDLSRIESGHLEIKLEAVAITPLINACVTQMQPLAIQRLIKFTLDLNASCTVQADQLRLREVLNNLLSNAVKYNREGGEIHILCTPAGEQHVRISVRDTGRGIAADALPRLFKSFERMESAFDGIEGSGIGLALSKKLVEAMHGVIGVESMQGTGSTFWFELPLSASSANPAKAAARKDTPVSGSSVRSKLLYVEDNPANLRLVQKIISTRKNIDMLAAESAEAGLKIAAEQLPDLILLDIQLPGMDGFEALRHLRDNPVTRDIPVIAVSANAMAQDIARGKEAGFVEYLTKPLDVSRFIDLVEKIINPEKS
jgi:PAS domain S-box-containing protein